MYDEYDLELYPEDFALARSINESIALNEKYQALQKAKEDLQSFKAEHRKAVKETLDKAIAFAKANNIECISKTMRSASLPINWQCKDGHKWKETLSSLSAHATCPSCEKLKLKNRLALDASSLTP